MPPFEKGNQISVGNKGGRPSKYCHRFSIDELCDLFDEWSKGNDSLILSDFSAEHSLDPKYVYESLAKHPEFSIIYRTGKARLAGRRERLYNAGGIKDKSYSMYQSHYDYYLDEYQRDKTKFEAEAKKDQASEHKEVTLKLTYDPNCRVEIPSEKVSTSNSDSPS